jgi:hypothetical protein
MKKKIRANTIVKQQQSIENKESRTKNQESRIKNQEYKNIAIGRN